MNLVYADVIAIAPRDGMTFGGVRVGGAVRSVPLDLIPDAEVGDKILLCDGVATAKLEKGKDVPGDSREAN